MKVKLTTVFSPEVQAAFTIITKAPMPIKFAYAVTKNLKKLDAKLKDIDKVIADIRKKHGAAEANKFQVPPENSEAFNKEASEYLLTEEELDVWKLPLSKLIECGVKLTPNQVMLMEDFIEDDSQDGVPQAASVA